MLNTIQSLANQLKEKERLLRVYADQYGPPPSGSGAEGPGKTDGRVCAKTDVDGPQCIIS
jgi:hypothetical protein